MDDVVFLYDQVNENVARIHSFSVDHSDTASSDGNVQDDVDHVACLQAKRDLLTFERAV